VPAIALAQAIGRGSSGFWMMRPRTSRTLIDLPGVQLTSGRLASVAMRRNPSHLTDGSPPTANMRPARA